VLQIKQYTLSLSALPSLIPSSKLLLMPEFGAGFLILHRLVCLRKLCSISVCDVNALHGVSHTRSVQNPLGYDSTLSDGLRHALQSF
jgi:hypothetical protein